MSRKIVAYKIRGHTLMHICFLSSVLTYVLGLFKDFLEGVVSKKVNWSQCTLACSIGYKKIRSLETSLH
jgi:hypothetical protein